MKLIARKPCSFAGRKFYIGDEIPLDSVMNPTEQEKWGVLAIIGDNEKPAEAKTVVLETISVVVPCAEGDMPLTLTREGLQEVVTIMTGKPAEAEAVVSGMTDGDALILLHMCDSRKAVKAAAEARAKAINAEESER